MIEFPRISIVTAVYNGEAYLEECMNSILSQGYPNLEYIVIDGGSTDQSPQIIQKYADRLTYWISEKDNGMYDALNKGFAKASGEIMGWLNADDLLMPRSLFFISGLFQNHAHVEWVQGLPLKIATAGFAADHYQQSGCKFDFYLKRYPQYIPFIQQESTFWKQSLWERAGGYLDTRYKLAGDFELWMRFFEHAPLYYTGGLIGGFRIHGKQLSHDMLSYLTECSRAVDESIQRLPSTTLAQIKFYKRLLQVEKLPLVSRITRRVCRRFYAEHIEPKRIKWIFPR